ncbi:hypothetical protein [Sphingopyxis granuli]|uniref:hypothetical protein n=1 Tax=Sphingopyxis granuli TaxID=267128 RepID=UPI001BAF3983|nr:hypothetical protein [Sphingopyxis granuli]QUM73957.1 hypothetical protein ICN83_08975 [Sphingopyxis granuli]
MKNVTIALDDETHRRARIRAAELGTSLSALVKDYLRQLADAPSPEAGVREMPMPFTAAPAYAAGPPTIKPAPQNAKPRQPGALRGKTGVADDFDEWPEGFLDALYGEDTEAARNWYK